MDFERDEENNNNGYTFEEALLQKSTIKMDITIILDGKFMEITDNYFFTILNTKHLMINQEKNE